MTSIICNLCGSDQSRELYPSTLEADHQLKAGSAFLCTSPDYGQHYRIVKCINCGFVYANPRGQAESIINAYQAVEDPVYLQEREGRELTFRKHLGPMHQLTGAPAGRKLLDVGAYVGVFVQVAREAGWDAMGVEPSTWGVAQAQKAGLPVVQGTLATANFAPESFDVITIWDVIEHFDDPSTELRHVWQLLKPGGFVVIHTIDVDSITARLMGSHWPFLMEMHVMFFSRQTLRAMLEKLHFIYKGAHTEGRYLRLGYLAGRVKAAFGSLLGKPVESLVKALNLNGLPIPINTLDLFTAYAQKPATSQSVLDIK
jgi:2-polyprenyl-3-methyl-5-hydroxy-6-metoxy-1,4-benzoquinol methylase